MKNLRLLFGIATLSFAFYACVNPPDYPDVPEITYEGVNKTTVYQDIAANPNDTLIVFFSFTDGDGDLSIEDTTDIFLIDSRSPGFTIPKAIPDIPEEGTGNGLSGDIILRIPNKPSGICCIDINTGIVCAPNPNQLIDTFSYSIQIRDRAGNFSNLIRTEPITILCQ